MSGVESVAIEPPSATPIPGSRWPAARRLIPFACVAAVSLCGCSLASRPSPERGHVDCFLRYTPGEAAEPDLEFSARSQPWDPESFMLSVPDLLLHGVVAPGRHLTAALRVEGADCGEPPWPKGHRLPMFPGPSGSLRCARRGSSPVLFQVETKWGSCTAAIAEGADRVNHVRRPGGATPLSLAVGSIRDVPRVAGAGPVREFVVSVRETGSGEEREFVVRGPLELVDLDECPRAQVVEDRLLVLTDSVIAVFDLESGEQLVDLVGAPGVTATSDGRRVAFETLQPELLPEQVTSSVIQVLDVLSLVVEPVFPGRRWIESSQSGQPRVWTDAAAERHSARDLVIAGRRLAFYCVHAGDEPGTPREVYLVVVDLGEDLSSSHFTHRPVDRPKESRPEG